jgi:uncharacterized delta-60 repeat protein
MSSAASFPSLRSSAGTSRQAPIQSRRKRLSLERLEERTVLTPGFLDPTFGNIPELPGRVVSDFGGEEVCTSVSLQADGKIVAAGYQNPPTGFDKALVLARYNADGSLDDSFGSGGRVLDNWGASAEVFSVIIQPDGKIVVAGDTHILNNDQFALARYNSDGSPDSSFGSGGKVVTEFGASSTIFSLALEPDGKIVAAGAESGFNHSLQSLALARYNSNGSLDDGGPADSTPDDSFGTLGKAVSPTGGTSLAAGVSLQPDGRIVAVGTVFHDQQSDFVVTRFLANGSPDSDFDADGQMITDFAGGYDAARSVAIQTDGKIVVAGSATVSALNDIALARYNADGSPDLAFGDDGKVTTPIGAGVFATAVALQADGKIVAAGQTFTRTLLIASFDFALARYNADGSLDKSFSFDGLVVTDSSGSNEAASSVAIAADGKIVVAGTSKDDDFTLARYQAKEPNQPPAIANQTLGIAENSAAGTVVGSVSASDPDSGQTLSYQINSGNASGAFAIDSLTGQITVVNSAALDFETAPTFSLTVQVTDSGSPALSASATMTINLSNVNEAPVNQVPTSQQLTSMNHSLIFSAGTGNTISVSDPDTGTTVIQVDLAVLHGSLTLASTSGLTFIAGDGQENRAMIFRGTFAAVNAALDGLTYAPDRGYVGSDSLTITSDDLGSGIGASLVDSDSVAIQVQQKRTAALAVVHRANVQQVTAHAQKAATRTSKTSALSLSIKHSPHKQIAAAAHATRAHTTVSRRPQTTRLKSSAALLHSATHARKP